MLDNLGSSSDDDIGPALPSSAPKKKRRKLPYEKLYISALPASPRYSKSLMHKDQLSFVTMAPFTDFLITSSVDGVVKFWKKDAVGIEFVKEFKAHTGEIRSVSVSQDGRSFATAGTDKTVKLFDVITFGQSDSFRSVSCSKTDNCRQISWLCYSFNLYRGRYAGFMNGVLPSLCLQYRRRLGMSSISTTGKVSLRFPLIPSLICTGVL